MAMALAADEVSSIEITLHQLLRYGFTVVSLGSDCSESRAESEDCECDKFVREGLCKPYHLLRILFPVRSAVLEAANYMTEFNVFVRNLVSSSAAKEGDADWGAVSDRVACI